MDVLFAKLALQATGQLIPLGVLETVPDPLGVIVTPRIGLAAKVAVTAVAAVIATEHALVPLQAPLQPVNE
jgi:dUTPase